MKKSKTAWLITAALLITFGIIIFLAVLFTLDFDLTKLSTKKYKTNIYTVTEDFKSIDIDVTTAEIQFALSDDNKCKVKSYDEEKILYFTAVENNILKIEEIDNRKWYEHIGIYFEKACLTIYLPKENYEFLTVETDTGNINIPSLISFDNIKIDADTSLIKSYASVTNKIEIETSTGNIYLTDTNCKNLQLESNTGNIYLKNVKAQNRFKIESDTGNIKFENSDAQRISVKTSTGNVNGTLLSGKTFITKTSTGNVNVPNNSTGGKCEITTSTGNINLKIE